MDWSTILASGGVSALVAGGMQYLNNRSFLDFQLRRQHQQEQRVALHKLIGEYRGRLLEAALDWDRRMVQLYDGRHDALDPPDDQRLDPEQYYYQSVVFRFLQLTALARRFEAEAFYIDADVAASDDDFDLLRYAKAFLWVMIHAEISPDDGQPGKDHFRSDAFRPLLDLCYAEPVDEDGTPVLPASRSRGGELIFDRRRCMALLRCADQLGHRDDVAELLEFFDGVRPHEKDEETGRHRRRWDRIVALHLFVLAFIAKCGYQWHQDVDARIAQAVRGLDHPDDLLEQFTEWRPRLGLGEAGEMDLVMSALARPADTPVDQAERVPGRRDQAYA